MTPKYPLEQLLSIKKDRVDKAEKVVKEKQKLLDIEKEKLKKIEEERDIVKNHKINKLLQLRKALDEGTTSSKVLDMKRYIGTVEEKLQEEEEKVKKQKEEVAKAKAILEKAESELKKCRKEEEKTSLHKEEWMKEALKEEAKQEEKEQDEMGQLLFQLRRWKN